LVCAKNAAKKAALTRCGPLNQNHKKYKKEKMFMNENWNKPHAGQKICQPEKFVLLPEAPTSRLK
jgi:hypothetical protein